MAKSSSAIETLSNDYFRYVLFGSKHASQSMEMILSELHSLAASESDAILSRWEEHIAATRNFGAIARKMARQGIVGDSLELETLLIKATIPGQSAARQYVLKQYQEEMESIAPESALEISHALQQLHYEEEMNVWDIFTPMEDEVEEVPEEEEKPTTDAASQLSESAPAATAETAEVKAKEAVPVVAASAPAPSAAAVTAPEESAPTQVPDTTKPFKLPKEWITPLHRDPKTGLPSSTTYAEHMRQYCFFGLNPWSKNDGEMMKLYFAKARSLCYDRAEEQLSRDKRLADQWILGARKAMEHAMKNNHGNPCSSEEVRAYGYPLTYVIQKKLDEEKQGKPTFSPTTKPRSLNFDTPTPKPPSPPPTSIHSNCIYTLKPAHEWELYMDESFLGKDLQDSFTTEGNGLIAGVLTTPKNPLPPQKRHHAGEEMGEAARIYGDNLVDILLHHEQCGVLAVPVKIYKESVNWATSIASYIDLVLHLLPMPKDNNKVRLTIYVELERIYESDESFDYIRDACYYNLLISFPERAKRINLDIQVMGKNHPYNAYADIVANTCMNRTSRGGYKKDRFLRSQWEGSCFLNIAPEKMSSLWDYMHLKQSNAAPQDWDLLLENDARSQTPTLISAILDALGHEACHNPEVWQEYLNYTVAHLNSKAINLNRLAAQLNWLKRHLPYNAELPPRVKLLWLTAKLAQANHIGEVGSQSPIDLEFTRLRKELFEEDAPLTCFATLHLAVQKTNELRFEEARQLLLDYARDAHPEHDRVKGYSIDDAMNDKQLAAMVGLRYYGQFLSSLGQHEAFLGHHQEAVQLLTEAIRCFERLSENRDKEIAQTSAYLATAQMDADVVSPVTKDVLEKYLGMPLATAAKTLAQSVDDGEKYHHHILLRYLAQSQDSKTIQAYLSAKGRWSTGTGHPWEMIDFYRALLLQSPEERLDYMRHAESILKEMPGATLQLIRCVILGALHALTPDTPMQSDYSALVQRVREELPALDERVVRTLLRQADVPMAPLELARAVLPFNFR